MTIELSNSSRVSWNVRDIAGSMVLSSPAQELLPGDHTFTVNAGAVLKPGIYLLHLSVNDAVVCRKLVIQ
jgi:hypothetical protein